MGKGAGGLHCKKINRWGHRFGFVRFFDVRNARRLEQELDSIRVGVMKLHVNLPRYSRQSSQTKVGTTWRKTKDSGVQQKAETVETLPKVHQNTQKV